MTRRTAGAALVAAMTILGSGTLPAQREREVEVVRAAASRGWLGISFMTENENGAATVVVDQVLPGSAAQRAGVAEGDTVLRIDGRTASDDAVEAMRSRLHPGDTVRLRLRHRGSEVERTVVAARRPGAEMAITNGMIRIDGDSSREPFIIRMDSLGSIANVQVRRMLDSLGIQMHGLSQALTENGRTMRIYVDSMRGPAHNMRIRVDTIRRHLDSLVFRRDSLRQRLRRMDGDGNVVIISGDGDRTIVRDGQRVIITGDSARRVRITRGETVRMRAEGEALRAQEIRLRATRDAMRGATRAGTATPFFMDVGRRALGGAELVDVDEKLGSYFSTRQGALVLRVSPRTPAARAGLEPGDVVVRVGDRAVTTVAELRGAVSRAPRGSVQLQVLRHGRRQNLTMQWEGAGSETVYVSPSRRDEVEVVRMLEPTRLP
jgi:membrane-associated protease RseP (regulator of RpoE activity)